MAITNLPVSTPANFFEYTDTAIGNTADAVKASSTLLYWVTIDNSSVAAATYVKLFNLAAGSVTVGTSIPDEVIYVPANARITVNYATVAAPGKTFGTALSACATTAGGTAGNTGPSSNVICTLAYV